MEKAKNTTTKTETTLTANDIVELMNSAIEFNDKNLKANVNNVKFLNISAIFVKLLGEKIGNNDILLNVAKNAKPILFEQAKKSATEKDFELLEKLGFTTNDIKENFSIGLIEFFDFTQNGKSELVSFLNRLGKEKFLKAQFDEKTKSVRLRKMTEKEIEKMKKTEKETK